MIAISVKSPTSQRGRLRAAMEQTLRDSGCRFCMVRLPEYYGPHVVTLTALPFRAALRGTRTFWPGPLDVEVEFVFMLGIKDCANVLRVESPAEHQPAARRQSTRRQAA